MGGMNLRDEIKVPLWWILFVLAIMTGFVFIGCRNPGNKPDTTVIEGCEYFLCDTYAGHYVLVHKGNCTNTIHQR